MQQALKYKIFSLPSIKLFLPDNGIVNIVVLKLVYY